jgi:pyruvate kinase
MAFCKVEARPAQPPLVIATVGPDTTWLDGVDMVRIDAAHGSLAQLGRLRASYDCPALLDLPGCDTTRRTSLLTTSEFLVFASAEGFSWIGLRGVLGVEEIHRAREALDPSVRVAASVHLPDQLTDQELGDVASAADALVLPFGHLAAELGVECAVHHVERALVVACRRRRPLLLAGGLLSSMTRSIMPEIEQLERLAAFAQDGCAGFVLTDETSGCPHPQLSVDTLHLVLGPVSCIPEPAGRGATVAGAPTFGRCVDPRVD